MARFHAVLLLLALLLAAGPARAEPSPEQTIRRFLVAVYSADAAAYEACILPWPGSESLLQGGPADPPVEEGDLEDLDPRQESPVMFRGEPIEGDPPIGARVIWTAGFRGQFLVIPMELTAEGWRVDVRFWVASGKENDPADPEVAIRKFLFYLLARNREKLAEVAAEGSALEPLLAGEAPFEDQYYAVAMEMPVARARPGEVVRLPEGGVVEVPEPSEERAWFLGQYGPGELAFEVVKEGGDWKVVPRDYVRVVQGR